MPERPYVVVNPAAQNGRVGRDWDALRAEIESGLGKFDFGLTKSSEDTTALTRQALRDGYREVLSLGGDGTHSLVVNGFFENGSPVAEGAKLGLLPVGTGGDFKRLLRVHDRDLRAYARRYRDGAAKTIDVGHVSHVDHDGKPTERFFVNIASCGSSGEVDRIVNQSGKMFGGKVSFMLASARAFIGYRPPYTTITVDGEPVFAGRLLVAAACNGQYFGGGMKVAPDADPTDGLLDVVIIEFVSKARAFIKMGGIYSGKHVELPEVRVLRGKVIRLDSPDPCLLDIDGEAPGRLPAEIKIVPGALTLKGWPT